MPPTEVLDPPAETETPTPVEVAPDAPPESTQPEGLATPEGAPQDAPEGGPKASPVEGTEPPVPEADAEPSIEDLLADPTKHDALMERFPSLRETIETRENKRVQRYQAEEQEKRGADEVVRARGRDVLARAYLEAGLPYNQEIGQQFEGQMGAVITDAYKRAEVDVLRRAGAEIMGGFELTGDAQRQAYSQFLEITRSDATTNTIAPAMGGLITTIVGEQVAKLDADREKSFDQRVRAETDKRLNARAKETKTAQAKEQQAPPSVDPGATGGAVDLTDRASLLRLLEQTPPGPERESYRAAFQELDRKRLYED